MRRWVVGVMAVVALGGCGTPAAGPGEEAPPVPVDQRAREVLAGYEQAAGAAGAAGGGPRFVPAGGLTGYAGGLEEENEDYKAAIGAGRIEAAVVLPAAPRETGTVVWDGAAKLMVPLLDADEALHQVVAENGGECADCTTVPVTGARLTTTRISTTRGEAEVPAWEFALKDSAFRITRVAVAPSGAMTYTPPPGTSGGLAAESVTVSGRTLTVRLTGSRGPASEPCGADYSARVVESSHAVVVIIDERRYGDGYADDELCTMAGFPRTATVELAEPLGERAVLDVQQGIPIPLSIQPR
ncbi:hypothetical protein AB0J83_43175 [Actinoplanes sp. NPDC049596]|uniref:hypothetical protein n=1 Tax=unclassified Actinoplanes TaxID=2626549 RepID=UPI003429AADB